MIQDSRFNSIERFCVQMYIVSCTCWIKSTHKCKCIAQFPFLLYKQDGNLHFYMFLKERKISK